MRFIHQSTVAFLERFGKMKRVLHPGIVFYIPFVDTITPTIDLRETFKNIEKQRAITKDNVEVDIDGYFFYRVTDPEKYQYSILNPEDSLKNLSTSVSRSEIGKCTLDDIFQNRESLNERIKLNMNQATQDWGVECLNYEILKLDPTEIVKHALLEVGIAERKRRKEVILSEAQREYKERISISERDAEMIIREAEFEGNNIWNQEFKKGLLELQEALDGHADKQQIMNYLLTEEYLNNFKKMLGSKNLCVLPESGPDGSSLDTLGPLAMVLAKAGGFGINSGNIQQEIQELVAPQAAQSDKHRSDNKKKTHKQTTQDSRYRDQSDADVKQSATYSSGLMK